MTTTQIKHSGAAHVTGATVSVTSASPNMTDSANGFLPSDVGRSITSTSTSGRKVLSLTSPGALVMDGNASASTGPQTATFTPVLTNVTRKAVTNCVDKTTAFLPQLPVGAQHLAQCAINMWTNAGGVGAAATRAQKIMAAQGLFIQET
jgi:hypothetical protein